MINEKYKLHLELIVTDNSNNKSAILSIPYHSSIIETSNKEYPISSFDKIELRLSSSGDYSHLKFIKDSRLYAEMIEFKLNEAKIEETVDFTINAIIKIYESKSGRFVPTSNIDYKSMTVFELEDYLESIYNYDIEAYKYLAINHYILDKDYIDLFAAKDILEAPVFTNDNEAGFYLFKATLIDLLENDHVDIVGTIKHISWSYTNQLMSLVNIGYESAVKELVNIRDSIYNYYLNLCDNNMESLISSRRHNTIPNNAFLLVYENEKGEVLSGDISLEGIDDNAYPIFGPNKTGYDISILAYNDVKSDLINSRSKLKEYIELTLDDSLNVQILESFISDNISILTEDVLGYMNDYISNYKKKIFFETEFESLY